MRIKDYTKVKGTDINGNSVTVSVKRKTPNVQRNVITKWKHKKESEGYISVNIFAPEDIVNKIKSYYKTLRTEAGI